MCNALKKSFRVFQIGGFQNIEPSLYAYDIHFSFELYYMCTVLWSTCNVLHNREAHVSLRGCALDLLVALPGLFLFVALGVLGRADQYIGISTPAREYMP